MKTVFLVSACLLFVMTSSAQKFALKKHNNKVVDNMLVGSNKEFKKYASNVNVRLDEVNTSLRQLEFLSKYEVQSQKKFDSKVHSLQVEYSELRNDLKNFMQYGIGDWKLFMSEFNSDLSLVIGDINMLESKFEVQDLIVGK